MHCSLAATADDSGACSDGARCNCARSISSCRGDAAPAPASETLAFILLGEMVLTTVVRRGDNTDFAVRQTDKADFDRLILKPASRLHERWDIKERPEQAPFIGCASALAHFVEHPKDAFEARQIPVPRPELEEAKRLCIDAEEALPTAS